MGSAVSAVLAIARSASRRPICPAPRPQQGVRRRCCRAPCCCWGFRMPSEAAGGLTGSWRQTSGRAVHAVWSRTWQCMIELPMRLPGWINQNVKY